MPNFLALTIHFVFIYLLFFLFVFSLFLTPTYILPNCPTDFCKIGFWHSLKDYSNDFHRYERMFHFLV